PPPNQISIFDSWKPPLQNVRKLYTRTVAVVYEGYPLHLGEGRVRASGFGKTCDPHPALQLRLRPIGLALRGAVPLPRGEGLTSYGVTIPFYPCQKRII